MTFVSIYNFLASVLRSIGNTVVPLLFLAAAAVTNIVLDLVFILALDLGVAGAALATVIAQALSAFGVSLYVFVKAKDLCPRRQHRHYDRELLRKIISNSVLTSIQQSIMNFGILMVQGLVNSFGFAAKRRVCGCGENRRIRVYAGPGFRQCVLHVYRAEPWGEAGGTHPQGHDYRHEDVQRFLRAGVWLRLCVRPAVDAAVVKAGETEIIAIGVQYLHIEGVFYVGIGLLFLLYGLFRGYGRAGVSIVLTVVSLGSRVALAYALSAIPAVGMVGIWWSVPIGWALADIVGIGIYLRERKQAA